MDRLTQVHLKKTEPRTLILQILERHEEPLTSQDVYNLLFSKTINLSTVYRTLESFTEKGICKKELNQEGSMTYILDRAIHKHILICKKCGKKTYLDFCPYLNASQEILSKTGFLLQDSPVELYGLCQSCQNK